MAAKKLKIGFTYDAKNDYKLESCDSHDKFAEFDSEKTLSEIENALKTSGNKIERIGNAKSLVNKIIAGERWDVVFNIAEGLNSRNRESQVPAILELYDIPYTGSDALTMGLTLDKALAKMVVRHHKIPTPDFLEICSIDELKHFNLKFPCIVKPSKEGTSKGISAESIVRDFENLKKRTQLMVNTYNQPALVEEFITGQEFTVAVIGNAEPEVLPPVQIAINNNTDLGEEFYTHDRVANDEIQYICPAKAERKLLDEIEKLALDSYHALGCRDLGRIDVRVDSSGKPYFLECNPLPSLGQIDVFPLLARAMGITYNEIICRILEYGCKRYDL